MVKFFGTDGIRGVVGQKLTHDLAVRAGRAAAQLVGQGGCILVGLDTRESCSAIAHSFMGAAAWGGVDCVLCGVAPTPQLAYCTRAHNFDLGVMISASHNAAHYNGLKFFDKNGYKLQAQAEQKLENLMGKRQRKDACDLGKEACDLGKISCNFTLKNAYKNALKKMQFASLKDYKILLDLGEGASHESATFAFGMLDCQTIFAAHRGIGRRINEGCGAAHPQMLSKLVVKTGAKMGFSFDGDADRIMACDCRGGLIDGDKLLYINALDLHERGLLKSGKIVGTVMSNLGLELALKLKGIELVRTAVGDKFVVQRMMEIGAELGGESSGHLIFGEYSTTGDGVLAALLTADLVARKGDFELLLKDYEHCPQIIKNVELTDEIRDRRQSQQFLQLESRLNQQEGLRLLIRESGTEPILRIMAESKEQERAKRAVELAAEALCD